MAAQMNLVPQYVSRDILDRAQRRKNFQADQIVPRFVGTGRQVPIYGSVLVGDARYVGSYAGLDPRVGKDGKVNSPASSNVSRVDYTCDLLALEQPVDEATSRSGDYDLESREAAGIVYDLLVYEERRIAAMAGDTSLWTGSFNIGAPDQWAAQAGPVNTSANPVRDMQVASNLLKNRGVTTDTVIVSSDVSSVLSTHPAILSAGSHSVDNNLFGDDRIRDLLARIFGCAKERVFLMDAVHNTAAQGQAVALAPIYNGFIWAGKNLGADGAVADSELRAEAVGMFNPTHMNQRLWTYETSQGQLGSTVWRVAQTDCLVRLSADMGITIGNILS